MKNWLGSETPGSPAGPKVGLPPTSMMKPEGEETAIIAKGFKLEGKLDVAGPLRINGTVKGTVQSKSQVVLGDTAQIEGEIHCGFLSVAGKVKGNVHCTERLEILASGLVEGDVNSPSLGIEPGGILEGRCHMRVDKAPAEAGKVAKPPFAVASPGGEGKELPKPAGAPGMS